MDISFSNISDIFVLLLVLRGPSWPWLYGSWIYNNLCNRCLIPLMFWVWIPLRASFTTLCDKVCQWLATGRWFSPGTSVSSTNKTDSHDKTEILLKVALSTINLPNTWYDIIQFLLLLLLDPAFSTSATLQFLHNFLIWSLFLRYHIFLFIYCINKIFDQFYILDIL